MSNVCLAIPMQVTWREGHEARCAARGVERRVSLFMLQDQPVEVGDWVLVHVGYAIQSLEAEEARETWRLLEALGEDEARDA